MSALRFGTPLAGRDKLKSDDMALIHLFLGRPRGPLAPFVPEHEGGLPARDHLAFEPPQPRAQAPATHFRQPDLFWSAVRSNSAKRASMSSVSIAFMVWFRMLSAERTLVEAGVAGSSMTLPSVETAALVR